MLRILYSDVAPISEEVLNSLDGEVKTYLGLSISDGPKMTFLKTVVKIKSLRDLTETHVSCVEQLSLCAEIFVQFG
jgi:hypothetical protein